MKTSSTQTEGMLNDVAIQVDEPIEKQMLQDEPKAYPSKPPDDLSKNFSFLNLPLPAEITISTILPLPDWVAYLSSAKM